MRLTTGEELRIRLGLPDIDTIVEAARAATEEAVLHVETDLRTSLGEQAYSDLWITDAHDRTMGNHLKLKLSSGLLQAGTLAAGTGMSKEDAEADTSLTSGLIFNLERGTVVLTDMVVSKFISIRYTAGLPDDPNEVDEELVDLATAPSWLKPITDIKAICLLAASPELDNKDGNLIDGRRYERQYTRMVESRIRYLPGFRKPLL